MGQSGVGNQPIVGWCTPLGPPHAPRVGTLGWGGAPPSLGGYSTLGHRPPQEIPSPRAGAPPGGLYKGGQGEGSRTLCLGASLPLLHLFLLPQLLGEALPESCCIHHHAVVLMDLHQPLLPPCWIKKEETSR